MGQAAQDGPPLTHGLVSVSPLFVALGTVHVSDTLSCTGKGLATCDWPDNDTPAVPMLSVSGLELCDGSL